MTQRFIKGYTNNHLTWVMVDATDFATPESALSAATKIKIYGKVKGGTGVNFVSSGTGSLTNDIQHVGASALGIYTIALAKADLSDASNAWYDQYVVSLSATGAAYQTLVVDGGIMESFLSAVGSDAHSAAILAASNASEAQSHATLGASRILLVQSRLSDFQSVYTSDMSDVRSMLTALSDAISNVDSAVNSQYSDLASKIGNVSVTITASDISDIASAVAVAVGSNISDIYSLLSDTRSTMDSQFAVVSNYLSNASNFQSDILSTLGSQFAVTSNYLSSISAIASDAHSAAIVGASAASDAASGVTVLQSRITSTAATSSDLISKLEAGLMSDIYSAAILAASHASDAASQAAVGSSRTLLVQSRLSDFNSVYTSDMSDVRSMLTALSGLVSDAHSAAILAASNASDAYSAALLAQSLISDVDSALTSQYSDLKSAVGAVSVALSASDISDLASQVVEAIGSAIMDVNVVQVNEIAVSGAGTAANPWGPG